MRMFVLLLLLVRFGSSFPVSPNHQINEISNNIDAIQSKLVKAIVSDQLNTTNSNDISNRMFIMPGVVLQSFLTVINLVEEVFYLYGEENRTLVVPNYPKNILEILVGQGVNNTDANSIGTTVAKTIEKSGKKKSKSVKKDNKDRVKDKENQIDDGASNQSDEDDDEDSDNKNMVVDDDDDDVDEGDNSSNNNPNENKENDDDDDDDDDESEEDDDDEEDEEETPGGLLGAIIAGFLGTLSKPDGSVDVAAIVDLISGLSSPRDDGTYDFTGLRETINSFFGGDGMGGGGSDIGGFLGGLISAVLQGIANPPGVKGTGTFVGNLVNSLLPGLSAPPPDEDSKPELDTGGFVWNVLSTILSGSIPSFGETDKPSLIQTKWGVLKFIIGFITSLVNASKGG